MQGHTLMQHAWRRAGEMIDRIEFSVERSHNYVAQAKKELTIARQYQSKARHVCYRALLQSRGGVVRGA